MNSDLHVDRASLPEEVALDPGLAIVDSHHHLWLRPPRPSFQRYALEDIIEDIDTSGHRVTATVFVECGSAYLEDGPEALRPVGEVAFVDEVAQQAEAMGRTGICSAIVGYANLLLGSQVAALLDLQQETSRRFRGIRFKTAFDAALGPGFGGAEPGAMLRPTFLEGAIELVKRGLSLDAWLFHSQLPDFVSFARTVPDLRIVLNHLGGPIGVGPYAVDLNSSFADWRAGLAAAAALPNVVLKLGSLNMSYTGLGGRGAESATIADFQRDHLLTAIDLFGPGRCMFESNFPVDRTAVSYGRLWNVFKQVSERFSSDERRDLFAATAARTYRIDL